MHSQVPRVPRRSAELEGLTTLVCVQKDVVNSDGKTGTLLNRIIHRGLANWLAIVLGLIDLDIPLGFGVVCEILLRGIRTVVLRREISR